MIDTIIYKVPNDVSNYNFNHRADYPSSGMFDSKEILVINNTGVQTVIFVPEELYPDEQ